jgi:YfiH family protein
MTLRHPLLDRTGVAHGFGSRTTATPAGLLRPRQVHGSRVVSGRACAQQPAPEADAVVSGEAGVLVGVVTADCVPLLIASESGRAVGAIHAGWRGLARGVVRAGVDALRHLCPDEALLAVVGPHIGPCCYEVDDPVLDALAPAFPGGIGFAQRPTRAGHARLDLGALASRALELAGVPRSAHGAVPDACTSCDALRFHSYRRDGPRAGRLVHHIAARPPRSAS